MNEEFQRHLEKFDDETRKRFILLYDLVHESTSRAIQDRLWAKLPSFYVGDHFVRIIPFRDHVNIEAKAVISYRESLGEYQITPKGMLQIKHQQEVPVELLKMIIRESLE